MAEEMVKVRWCDVDLKESQERVQACLSMILGTPGDVRTLDLCESHAEGHIEVMLDQARKYGEPYVPEEGPRRYQCAYCEKDYASLNRLGKHEGEAHPGLPHGGTGKN